MGKVELGSMNGAAAENQQENGEGIGLYVTPEALHDAIEYIRSLQKSSQFHAQEARLRQDGAALSAQIAADATASEVHGAIELLSRLAAPPNGFVNWSEVVDKEDS